MKVMAARGLLVIRWWAGLSYLLGGVGAVIAAPIMIAEGNWGGVYMVIGGAMIFALGWLIHPWGLQRNNQRAKMPRG
jgi:hypothetical protein